MGVGVGGSLEKFRKLLFPGSVTDVPEEIKETINFLG